MQENISCGPLWCNGIVCTPYTHPTSARRPGSPESEQLRKHIMQASWCNGTVCTIFAHCFFDMCRTADTSCPLRYPPASEILPTTIGAAAFRRYEMFDFRRSRRCGHKCGGCSSIVARGGISSREWPLTAGWGYREEGFKHWHVKKRKTIHKRN